MSRLEWHLREGAPKSTGVIRFTLERPFYESVVRGCLFQEVLLFLGLFLAAFYAEAMREISQIPVIGLILAVGSTLLLAFLVWRVFKARQILEIDPHARTILYSPPDVY